MNLTYQAKDADEFKELCAWLRDNGYANGRVAMPRMGATAAVEESTSLTPWEDRYNMLTVSASAPNGKRLRLTTNENILVNDKRTKTREDIARERCEEIEGVKSDTSAPPAPDISKVGDML